MRYEEDLKNLFEATFNEKVVKYDYINSDGSARKILRLFSNNRTVVGVWGPDKKENLAFVKFSYFFKNNNLPVPEIYAFDEKKQIYLETDLGDKTLFSFLREKRNSAEFPLEVKELYKKALKYLALFQVNAFVNFDFSFCYPRKEFDEQSMMWDLNYFKYYFLKLGGISFDEQKLEDDYKNLVNFMKDAPRNFFLYRDFQSRNIMVKDGNLFFIDYQGGRKGFLAYDVASLLYDAKAEIPPKTRNELLEYYLNIDCIKKVVDRSVFLKYYYSFVYIRLMQAMGAYGLRGFYERKPHFLTSVPYVIKNIEWLVSNVELEIKLPELIKVLKRITTSSYLRQFADKKMGLNLRIYSFSYKDGFPKDNQGHNGGFVFDARCLSNPGRDPYYVDMTGKDRDVILFFEKNEGVQKYFKNCLSLVNQAVDNYLSRNFTELYVAFGCTGGRHRSVYLAEKLYQEFSHRENVRCHLRHLTLESEKTLK
ncbi:MAG: phosphotransferase [Elusimicrobiota bacterium]